MNSAKHSDNKRKMQESNPLNQLKNGQRNLMMLSKVYYFFLKKKI